MRVAVVSTDGANVNDHFGKAERFLIYEIKDTGLILVGERQSVPLSVNDLEHPFDAKRFEKVLSVIKDCKKVFVTQIGEVPAAKLKENGIEPVIFEGPIEKITARG